MKEKYKLEEKDKSYIRCGANLMIQFCEREPLSRTTRAGRTCISFLRAVRPVHFAPSSAIKAIQNFPHKKHLRHTRMLAGSKRIDTRLCRLVCYWFKVSTDHMDDRYSDVDNLQQLKQGTTSLLPACQPEEASFKNKKPDLREKIGSTMA